MGESTLVAAAVSAAEAWASVRPGLADPWLVRGAGAAVAVELAEHLRTVRAPARWVVAVGDTYATRVHTAVLVGDGPGARVVDLTVRQFDPGAPVPWVGPVSVWGQLVAEWLADHVLVRVVDPGEGSPGEAAGFLVYRPAGPGPRMLRAWVPPGVPPAVGGPVGVVRAG